MLQVTEIEPCSEICIPSDVKPYTKHEIEEMIRDLETNLARSLDSNVRHGYNVAVLYLESALAVEQKCTNLEIDTKLLVDPYIKIYKDHTTKELLSSVNMLINISKEIAGKTSKLESDIISNQKMADRKIRILDVINQFINNIKIVSPLQIP